MKATTAQELSHIFKEMRLTQELSQAKLAKKVGIRQDTVSAFEINPESTKLATLFKILSALNLELQIRPRQSAQTWPEEW